MVETGQIAQGEADEAMKLPIHLAPPSVIANKAPYFSDFVKAELLRQLKGRMTEQEVDRGGLQASTRLWTSTSTAALKRPSHTESSRSKSK